MITRYLTICADPAWPYRDQLTMQATKRGAASQYRTMSIPEICAMGTRAPRRIAGYQVGVDAFLWLWVTNSHLLDGSGAAVCRAWGFKPVQLITWVKAAADPGVEQWRQHPSFADFEVSTHGRVRRGPRLLKWHESGGGPYPRVTLCVDGKTFDRRVHGLVAETFLGPRPEGYDVDHLDGDKRNASLVNLEYVTRGENRRRSRELANQGGPLKEESELSMTPKAIQSRIARSRLQIGMGHLLRNCTEHMILATRGKTKHLLQNHSTPNVILAPRSRHSAKPQAAFDLIEQLTPGPYLELFARQRREGWESHGDQLPEEFAA